MEFTCVDICETGIVVSKNSEVVETSPGVAILRENRIITGFEAVSKQYEIPQFTFSRFWKDLNQRRLPNRNKEIRHNADLAYAHLRDIAKRVGRMDKVVVCVPSEYGESELSLLAGIFEALQIKITAVVDSSIACLSGWAPEGNYSLLRLYSHHATICRLRVDSHVALENVDVIENGGWYNIRKQIAEYAAATFLQKTRFYPFHKADSEQTLYNQIPDLLKQTRISNSFDISVVNEGIPYTVQLNSKEIADRIHGPIDHIRQKIDVNHGRLLLSELFSSLPGVEELFLNYREVDNLSCIKGITQNSKEVLNSIDTLYLIERLPRSQTPLIEETTTEISNNNEVTHLLSENHAFPIKNTPMKLRPFLSGVDDGSAIGTAEVFLLNGLATIKPNGQGISLNNEVLSSEKRLQIGDSIALFPTGPRYVAIRVTNSDEI